MRHLTCAAALAFWALAAASSATAQQTREHILLFTAKPTLFTPTLARDTSIAIDDTLDANNPLLLDPNAIPGENLTFDMRKVVGICLASDVDEQGIADGDTHWMAYSLKGAKSYCVNDPGRSCRRVSDCGDGGGPCELQSKFDRKDPRNQAIRVVDAYSDLRVDFRREALLLEPASFDNDTFQGLPGAAERYKCYDIKPATKVCSDDPRAACRRDDDCSGLGATCEKLPKFPRQTHPEGLRAILENPITPIFDAPDPDRPFDLRGVKMFCQAADTQTAGASVAQLREQPQSGLLCYAVKAARRACHLGPRDNEPCRKIEDCLPGGTCREEPKFDNRDPRVRDLRAEDQFLQHHLDLRKEALLCVPACKEPPAAPSFTPHVLRLNTIALDSEGHSFSVLSGLANPLITDAVSDGSINILLEADRFGDGKLEINGYTGSLDPANLGCNINNPALTCAFEVAPFSIDPDVIKTRTTCSNAGVILIPAEVEGTDSTPSAALVGGDSSTSFSFDLPFTAAISLNLAVRNVEVSGTLEHDGSGYTGLTGGVLEGAVIHREFKATASALPQGLCQGGGNNSEPCFLSDALCSGGTCSALTGTCTGGSNPGAQCGDDSACPFPLTGNPSDACVENYIGGFTPGQVAGLVDLLGRDLDLDGIKTCEGATNGGEPCASLSDCPNQNGGLGAVCTEFEASSIRLLFTARKAAITGVAP